MNEAELRQALIVKELERINIDIHNIRDIEVINGKVYISEDKIATILDKHIKENKQ